MRFTVFNANRSCEAPWRAMPWHHMSFRFFVLPWIAVTISLTSGCRAASDSASTHVSANEARPMESTGPDKAISYSKAELLTLETEREFLSVVSAKQGSYEGHNSNYYYASDVEETTGLRIKLYRILKSSVSQTTLSVAVRTSNSEDDRKVAEQVPPVLEFNELIGKEAVSKTEPWEWGH
jgi:hypothetical protein